MATTDPRIESMDGLTKNGWNKSQPGSLLRFASAQHARQTRRRLVSVAGGVAAACLLVAAVWQIPQKSGSTPFDSGGQSQRFSCQDVLSNVEDYFSDRLEPELAVRVEQHLKYCRYCHDEYEKRAEELGKELLVLDTKPVGRVSKLVYLAKTDLGGKRSTATQ